MEKYLQAKEIVEKKVSKDNPYYTFYIMALFGILSKYGDYRDAVDDIFQKTAIYIEKKPISQILKDHEIDDGEKYQKQDNDEDSPVFTFGLSSRGDNFDFDEEGNVYPNPTQPFLACSLVHLSPTSLFHAFIHEYNHLLKSYYNGCLMTNQKDSADFLVRVGLSITNYHFDKKEQDFQSVGLFDTLDEVVNVLQTTEMVEAILALKDIVPDPKVQQLFQYINPELMSQDFGYYTCTSTIRPLWQNDVFKNIIEAHLMDGDINEIIKNYDAIMGDGSFFQLDDLLQELDQMEDEGTKGEVLEQQQSRIKDVISQFQQKTQKMYEK